MTIEPDIAAVIDNLPPLALSLETLPILRARMPISSRPSAGVERTAAVLPGDPVVAVRLHRPAGLRGPAPCVISIHGGGYVSGTVELDDEVFDHLCTKLQVIGLSVDYRLAPETPYPGPLEDCYRAVAWTFANATELGIDSRAIGIRGASAGGGLAAALALLARDRGQVQPAFQLLESPMLDDRQRWPSSQLPGLAVWDREANEFGWKSYLGQLYGTDDVPAYAAPARSDQLTGLPVTFISVGGLDGFRDESIDYALRLSQADVPTELHLYPGAPHCYHFAPQSAVARQSRHDIDHWLHRQISRLTTM
jgi:acetyl esterase/lipase